MDRDRSDGKTTRPDGFRGSGRGRRNVFRSEPWQESGDQATSASRWNDASLPSSRTAWCKSCNRRGPLVEHNTGHVTPLPQRTVEEIHVTKGDASISATAQNALGTMEGGVDTNGARCQRLGRPDARSEGVVGWPRSRRLDSDLVLAEGNRRPRGQDDHRVHRRIGQCRRLDGEWIAPCVASGRSKRRPHLTTTGSSLPVVFDRPHAACAVRGRRFPSAWQRIHGIRPTLVSASPAAWGRRRVVGSTSTPYRRASVDVGWLTHSALSTPSIRLDSTSTLPSSPGRSLSRTGTVRHCLPFAEASWKDEDRGGSR